MVLFLTSYRQEVMCCKIFTTWEEYIKIIKLAFPLPLKIFQGRKLVSPIYHLYYL